MQGMLNSMTLFKVAVPGEAVSIVWEVEQMAHVVFVRNTSMSLVAAEVALFISAVWSIVTMTLCTHSSIAFA